MVVTDLDQANFERVPVEVATGLEVVGVFDGDNK
jgi:hypothetical protein